MKNFTIVAAVAVLCLVAGAAAWGYFRPWVPGPAPTPTPEPTPAVVTLPAEVKIRQWRLGRVEAGGSGKVRWINTSDDLDMLPDSSGRYCILQGAKVGTYRIAAYTGDCSGPSDAAYCRIVVEGDPVPPGPDPAVLITVPDVLNSNYAEAKKRLVGFGLKVVPDSAPDSATVTAQAPAGGSKVTPATTVTLTLSVEPPAPPSPIPADGFRVLIVEDEKKRINLPPGQLAILFDKTVRDYLNSKCVMGPDGKTKEWRIWPTDVQAAGESKLWQDAMKLKRDSLPWIVISTGKSGYQGPLPADVPATLELLKKYAEK